MMLSATTAYVVAVLFVATLVRSGFGFGEALFAVPLLALAIPVTIAAPVAVLVSITIAAVIVVQDWRQIHGRSTAWLVVSTLIGIPIGLLVLTSGHETAIRTTLGVVILLFALYSLVGARPPELGGDSRAWLFGCGLCAGVLGGAYGMNGPPLVIYGAMRRWSPASFRATLQGYFLPASLAGMAGYWIAGVWTPLVTRYYVLSLPAVVPAIFLGRLVNQRMRGDAFLRVVYIVLALVGAVLFAQAIVLRGR